MPRPLGRPPKTMYMSRHAFLQQAQDQLDIGITSLHTHVLRAHIQIVYVCICMWPIG